MIDWFAIVVIAIAAVSAISCLTVFLRGRSPNDFTTLPTLLVSLLLIAQVVIAIIAPFTGNSAVGDPLEFWMYLITALALPIGAGIWALIDQTKWANLVLTIVHVAVAVMMYRMMVIWLGV